MSGWKRNWMAMVSAIPNAHAHSIPCAPSTLANRRGTRRHTETRTENTTNRAPKTNGH